MAETFPPNELEELLAGYALGNLTPEEAETLRNLLATHPELAANIDQLQEVLEVIPYALPTVEPPAYLRSMILAATGDRTSSNRRDRRRSPALLWGTFASVLLTTLGLDNFSLRQQLTVSQKRLTEQGALLTLLQTPSTRLISFQGMDQLVSASGSAVIAPQHSEMILVLQNLPTPPTGQFYCLWTLANGQKIETGELKPNAQGQVFVKMPLSVKNGISGFAITLETTPTPTTPSGPMVMKSL